MEINNTKWNASIPHFVARTRFSKFNMQSIFNEEKHTNSIRTEFTHNEVDWIKMKTERDCIRKKNERHTS